MTKIFYSVKWYTVDGDNEHRQFNSYDKAMELASELWHGWDMDLDSCITVEHDYIPEDEVVEDIMELEDWDYVDTDPLHEIGMSMKDFL